MIETEIDLQSIIEKLKKELEEFKNTKVKCAIIGRSGTGKSSLINAIAGKEIAETGEVETTMEVSEPYAHKGLLLYDLPGCGTVNFPKDKYIEEFKVEQFDCVILATSDRFYEDDLYLIDELSKKKVPVYATRTKIDFSIDRGLRKDISELDTKVKVFNNLQESLKGYRTEGIYLTSADYPQKYDLSKMQNDIYNKLTSYKKDRWIADVNITSDKLLDEKRKVADNLVIKYAGVAAANGLNPIPGLDIAVDITLMMKMFKEIQEIYGLTEEQQKYNSEFLDKKHIKFVTGKISQLVLRYGAKEGIMVLLKKASTTVATKTFSKYIPIIGQAIAAGVGFKMTSSVGNDMVDDCEKVAKEILDTFKN